MYGRLPNKYVTNSLFISGLIFSVWILNSCGHRKQLSPGTSRTVIETVADTETVPVKPRLAGLTGFDSLKQSYDSLDSRYKASILATDRLKTQNSHLDTALHQREREIAELRKLPRDADGRHIQYSSVSGAKLKEELKEEKAANQTLIELGSVLHVSNLRIVPIHISASGRRVRETTKAKKTNDLRIVFDIDQNYVSGKGEKELFLVITTPKGKLQKVADWMPGTTRNFNNEQMPYTLVKKVVMKENEPLVNVMINCKLEHLEDKGKFRFALYQNGYMIGEKSLRLE